MMVAVQINYIYKTCICVPILPNKTGGIID